MQRSASSLTVGVGLGFWYGLAMCCHYCCVRGLQNFFFFSYIYFYSIFLSIKSRGTECPSSRLLIHSNCLCLRHRNYQATLPEHDSFIHWSRTLSLLSGEREEERDWGRVKGPVCTLVIQTELPMLFSQSALGKICGESASRLTWLFFIFLGMHLKPLL